MGTWSDIYPEHVREVIDTKLNDGQIEGLIATSVTLVEDKLRDSGLSNPILSEITRYITAHLVTMRDAASPSIITEEKIGAAQVKYNRRNLTRNNEAFVGFADTRFGEIAIMLDSTGTLGALGGKPPSIVSL